MSIYMIRKKTKPIFEKFGVRKAAIFGSYARGESKKTSDIDMLLKLKHSLTFFDVLRLKARLEKELRRKVDIVEYEVIKPAIKRYVLKHQMPLL